MLYINKNKDVFGAYFPLQNSWAPGLLKFPENFSNIFNEYAGFIEITLDEDDQIINVTPNEELFNTWKENLSSAI